MVAGTSAFQKSVVRLESFLGERIIDVINSTDLRAVDVMCERDPSGCFYQMGAQS